MSMYCLTAFEFCDRFGLLQLSQKGTTMTVVKESSRPIPVIQCTLPISPKTAPRERHLQQGCPAANTFSLDSEWLEKTRRLQRDMSQSRMNPSFSTKYP